MSPLVRLLTTVVVVLSVVVMVEAVVNDRQSGDVPGGKVTEGRVWTFQSRRGGGEPCTPTSLTVSLTNADQLIVRFFFAKGGFTSVVYNDPGESFSLPANDLPQDVVLIVIFAPPLSSSTSSCINSVDLQGCGQAPTTTTTMATTTTTPDVTTTTEEPTTTTVTTTPEPTTPCGVSPALDALYDANSIPVGGMAAGSCDVIPWQVSVSPGFTRTCGGSILDASHVLTAAVCIPASGSILVRAGEYDLTLPESSEQTRVVPVQNVSIHPDYVFSFAFRPYDIAVVRLSEPLDLTQPCVTPVCLDPNLVLSGQDCTASGWFRSDTGVNQALLRVGNVKTVSGENCVSAFNIPSSTYLLNNTIQLCAGSTVNNVDPCQAQTGGPLVCRDTATNTYIQAGIFSSAALCSSAAFPEIYTDVRALYDWIQEQITN